MILGSGERRRQRSGFSYGIVLLVLVVSTILVFSFASLSTAQLRATTLADSKEHARNLAQSAIYQAMDELHRLPNFGADGQTLTVDSSRYPPNSQGELTFSGTRALLLGVPRSYNNLASKTQASDGGAVVPAETVRLVGYGRCGESRVTLECLYFRPAFPTGLCVGSKISANNLYLAGLMPGQTYQYPPTSMPAQSLRPSDLHSNSQALDAVSLTGGSTVSGDVTSAGGASVSDSTVIGVVRSHIAPRQLPVLNLIGMRNTMAADNVQPSPFDPGDGPISWFVEAPGPELVVGGDLEMDGGLLYVNGKLKVTGRIHGRGAVVATGDIELGQGTNLESRDQVALAAGGNLKMVGTSKADHFFQGLVYSNGNLDVKNMTVVGTVVSHGNALVENVDFIQSDVSIVASVGAPMRISNNDDTVFWHVKAERNAQGETRYAFQVAVYYAPWVTVHDKGQYFVGEVSRENLTRDEVIAEMKTAVDMDYNAEQATSVPSADLMAKLPGYLDGLQNFRSGQYTVAFDLNEVLSPTQQARILLWRRLHH